VSITQDRVEEKIRSYAKKNRIIFDYDDMVREISEHIINPKFTEAKQKDLLRLIDILFSRIKNGYGEPLYDERNGKIVCEKIRRDIKKYMAVSFETLKKGIFKKFKMYYWQISDRYMEIRERVFISYLDLK
jgi:hypothetical protein